MLLAACISCTFIATAVPQPTNDAEDPLVLRVMTFNLWHGGDAGKQPLKQSVEVIKAARADIVGLQETHGTAEQGPRPDHAKRIAEMLGWHYFVQGGRTGIISRFRILKATPRKWGIIVELPAGRTAYVFNAHFNAAPYQPYQLLKIPYENAPFLSTEAEAIAAAKKARGHQVAELLQEVKEALRTDSPVLLTGDFNEPSHRDWTAEAVKAKRCPLPVEWPATKAVEEAGLIDGYRHVHSDVVKAPGLTWTPIRKRDDPQERHDRIDFVFAAGKGLTITDAKVVGESAELADIVVKPYPSDHRAVVLTITIGR